MLTYADGSWSSIANTQTNNGFYIFTAYVLFLIRATPWYGQMVFSPEFILSEAEWGRAVLFSPHIFAEGENVG